MTRLAGSDILHFLPNLWCKIMAIINAIRFNPPTASAPVLYTCPAGVSHAVVHVYANAFNSTTQVIAKLNSTTADNTNAIAEGLTTATTPTPSKVSMMLKPGDFISTWASGVGSGNSVLITGYEVL